METLNKRYKTDQYYFPGETTTLSPREYKKWCIFGCLILVVLLLVRSWQTFIHTSFLVEDSLLFSRYYGNAQPLTDVAVPHFGQPYMTLLSNVFSWLIAYADVRLQPLLYEATGFLWGVAAACCLFFSGLIRSKVVLLVGPLLMGLTAMNHIFYYTTIIYIMYNAVIILLVLLFYPAPKNGFAIALFSLLLLVLPWAGPYSVLAIPAALALLVLYPRCKKMRVPLLITVISTIGYFLTVEGNTTRLAHLKKWGVIRHYFQNLLEQIVFLNQLDHISPWFWIPVLFLIGICFYLFRRDQKYIRNSLVMFAISGGSLALFYLSIKFPLYLHPSDCHRVISMYFWCFFLLYTADRFFLFYPLKNRSAVFFSILILALVTYDNIRYPRKGEVDTIPKTFAFVNAVHRVEQLHLENANQFVVLRLNNPQMLYFIANAQVGSRNPNAKRLMPEDLPAEYRNPFIVR